MKYEIFSHFRYGQQDVLRSGRQRVQDAQTDWHPLHGGAGRPIRYHAVVMAAGA